MSASRPPGWKRYLRLRRADPAEDVDEELEFHLAMRVERNRQLGMTPEEAQREAIERFGDVRGVRATLVEHDQRHHASRERAELVADLLQDLRFGLRALRRSPAFALAAIVTLALGIGANTAIFSIVDAVVLRPLPYTEPERLVMIGAGSTGEYLALRERLRIVRDLAAWRPVTQPVELGGEAVRLRGAAITPGLLPLLGVAPAVGRGFTSADAEFGRSGVALISHGLWQRAFGGAADVLGRTVSIDGAPFTIVGVMPVTFHYPSDDVEYWQPFVVDPHNLGVMWGIGGRQMIGRLAPGATLSEARAEVRGVWPSLRHANPLWDPGPHYGEGATATPLQAQLVGSARGLLWMLFGATLLVLLIACVNVANLLLARAVMRERELAVRTALGGGRARLVRQLVTESFVLAFAGAALGVMLGWAAVRAMVAALPAGMPRAAEIGMEPRVLAFALALSFGTALLFGLIPALRVTNAARSGAGLGGAGQRATAGGSHHRLAGALVVGEVALAVTLVTASLLLLRSFDAMRAIAPGFDPSHVVAARISVPGARTAADAPRVLAFYDRVLDRMRALPGVRDAALLDQLPLAEPVWGFAARVQGQFEDFTHALPVVEHLQIVTPGYFAAMRIPVVRGRGFDERDRTGAPPVAMVSESLARRFWPNGDAIGQHVGFPYASPWIEIVGIVPDTKEDSLRDSTRSTMYVPWAQSTARLTGQSWLVARSTGERAATEGAVRSVVHDLDPAVAVSDVRSMDVVIDESVNSSRFTAQLVGAFALLALALGAVGIYGVMSYLVGERRREMGIRIALGASRGSVLRLVVRRAASLAGLGAIIGLLGAVLAARSLRQWLYGVSPLDPLTLILVPSLFLLVAALASAGPALRATKADPASALRAD